MSVKSPRVFVVDDDPQVLSVIGQLLAVNGLQPEMFRGAGELLESVSTADTGCVVTDLEMPGISGIDLQSLLLEMGSSLSVIVVTGHADVPKAIEIMEQGAVTLLEKPFNSQQLVTEVERAIRISQQTHKRRERKSSAKRLISSLTEEELEIMRCAAHGMPNKAISLRLDVSPRTVDRRRQTALVKLGVASVAAFAVMFAAFNDEI